MSDKELDAKQIEQKVHELHKSMEKVKIAQADRDDVVVEMKQAARTRLELLAKDLAPVFNDIPTEVDWFEFGLSHGEPSRLWIDLTTHIRMGRDRRVYELVKDTKLGRTLLFQTEDRQRMGEVITDYIAERMLDRERAIEGEWLDVRKYAFQEAAAEEKVEANVEPEKQSASSGLSWFLIGIVAAAAAVLAWGWFGDAPELRAIMEGWVERLGLSQ